MSGDGHEGGAPHHGGGGHDEEEHEEHINHEAWVIPYADLLTLLMVMFIALYAVGQADKTKFKKFAEGARSAFGGATESVLSGGPSVLNGSGAGQLDGLAPASLAHQQIADAALISRGASDAARSAEQQRLESVQKKITNALPTPLRNQVGFRKEARGLVVTIVTDQLLFPSGSAEIQPEGADILAQVAAAVRELPNQIAIEGHTDPSPISTGQFPSNWELSTGRASSVLRYLAGVAGLEQSRMTASGYADMRPIADNGSTEGRSKNRRVEIVVLNSVVMSELHAPAAEGGETPAEDRKSTRLNSSHTSVSRMPSSACRSRWSPYH